MGTQPAIIIFSAYVNDDYIFGALTVGALGYVLKNEPIQHLIEAIYAVNQGQCWFSPQLLLQTLHGKQMVEMGGGPLTPRELEIFKLIAQGLSNDEIAEKLCLALQTVKNHVRNVFLKFGVKTRLEVALRAIDIGLINFE